MDEKENSTGKSVCVYVITHKQFPYMVSDDTYKPLQVGTALNGKIFDLTDDTGDNISSKNKYFLDTTGLYWIWKNSPKYDIIGNEAYRRHFNLTKDEIVKTLEKYRVIASPLYLQNTIYEQYKYCHIIKDLESCEEVVKDLYPEYYEKFRLYIRNSKKLYIGNGFITTRDNYDRICSFCFNVLFKLEEIYNLHTSQEWFDYADKNKEGIIPPDHKIDGMSVAEYQMQVPAFLCERLMSFYVSEVIGRVRDIEYKRLDEEYSEKLS